MLIWNCISSYLSGDDLLAVCLLADTPGYAATQQHFARLNIDLSRPRFDALLCIAGVYVQGRHLTNFVDSLTSNISLWHRLEVVPHARSDDPDAVPLVCGSHRPHLTPPAAFQIAEYEEVYNAGFVSAHESGIEQAVASFARVREVEIITNQRHHPYNIEPQRPSILIEQSPESAFMNTVDTLSHLPAPLEKLSVRTRRNTPLSFRPSRHTTKVH